MKIHEVAWKDIKSQIKARNNPKHGLGEFLTWLRQMGFKYASAGSYGAVFIKDDMVCKIWDADDHCFTKFVRYCQTRRQNKHLPKFTKMRMVGEDFMAVFTKRYEKHNLPFKDALRIQRYISDAEYDIDPMDDEFGAYADADKKHQKFEQENIELAQTLMDIHDNFKSVCQFDLHDANFMKDSRGNIIVIDPVYDSALHLNNMEKGEFRKSDILDKMKELGIQEL